jgi:hypothetical protein
MIKTISLLILFTLILILLSGCDKSQGETQTPPLSSTSSPMITLQPSNPAENPSVLSETSTILAPHNAQPIEGDWIDISKVDSIIENNVIKADFIILGTITNFRYEKANDQSGNAVYTIFTLSVEKMFKGDPNTKEVLIKLPGGILNDETGKYDILPSRGYFSLTDKALVCLKKGEDDYYLVMIPLGTLWAKKADGNEFVMSKPNGERMTLDWMMGFISKTMRENNIPIVLPSDEIHPEPTGLSVR